MHYESWFQFRSRPFSTAPRLEDYYPAEAIELARKTVTSCIQRGAGPTLIVGPCGIGKTMLCQRLADEFRPRTDVALVSGTGMTTRRAMWQSILFELGLPFRQMEVGELRLSLIDHLSSQGSDYPGLVLIIDDANSVPSRLLEEVRMLSNLVRDGNWRVHLVLSGKQSLEEHLALPRMESFNQRIVARCYLKRFTHPETLAYVRHQFERAGLDAAAVVSQEGLNCVHEMSHGVARVINQLCDHALVMAWVNGKRELSDSAVREAWHDLQQLPFTDAATEAPEVEESAVVEFGSLDDDDPLPPIISEVSPEGDSADKIDETSEETATFESELPPLETTIVDSPTVTDDAEVAESVDEAEVAESVDDSTESQLTTIQDQITEINDGHDPVCGQPNRYPLVDFPVPPIASDPFQEFFEEEEIVVHDFGSLRAPAVQTHAQVTTDEGKRIFELMEMPPALDPSLPERVTQRTGLGDRPEPLEQDEEDDQLSTQEADAASNDGDNPEADPETDSILELDDNGMDDNGMADSQVDDSQVDDSQVDDGDILLDGGILLEDGDDVLLDFDDELTNEEADEFESRISDETWDEGDAQPLELDHESIELDSELEFIAAEDSTLLDEFDAEAWTASLDSSVLYEEVTTEKHSSNVIESGMLVIEQPEETLTEISAQYDQITTSHQFDMQTPALTVPATATQDVPATASQDVPASGVDDELAGTDQLTGAQESTATGEATVTGVEELGTNVAIAAATEALVDTTPNVAPDPHESLEKSIQGTFDTLFSTVQRLGRS